VTAVQWIEVVAAVVVILGGVGAMWRFVWSQRLSVWLSGASELLYDASGRPVEAFVLYVRSNRNHPVRVEACGVYGQDVRGDYWRISIAPDPWLAKPVTKGEPLR